MKVFSPFANVMARNVVNVIISYNICKIPVLTPLTLQSGFGHHHASVLSTFPSKTLFS
jgi:hypothetical protein